MAWQGLKLNLRVAQRQILTPGLVQMVSVLALNRLELREIAFEPLAVRVGKASGAWRYDSEQRVLTVDLHETASSQLIDVSIK